MTDDKLGYFETDDRVDGQFILQQPNQFLSVLAEAIQDNVAFYAHDLDGRFTYLGRSIKAILNLDPTDLLQQTIGSILSDSPENELVRSSEWSAPNSPAQRSGTFEIIDSGGSRVRVDYWRIHVFRGGALSSVSGIMRRVKPAVVSDLDFSAEQARQLALKVATLTDVERQVVEMAVDGHMNKKMASILDVAVRTIESRRSRAMSKLQTRSLSELVQLWMQVRRMEASGFHNNP